LNLNITIPHASPVHVGYTTHSPSLEYHNPWLGGGGGGGGSGGQEEKRTGRLKTKFILFFPRENKTKMSGLLTAAVKGVAAAIQGAVARAPTPAPEADAEDFEVEAAAGASAVDGEVTAGEEDAPSRKSDLVKAEAAAESTLLPAGPSPTRASSGGGGGRPAGLDDDDDDVPAEGVSVVEVKEEVEVGGGSTAGPCARKSALVKAESSTSISTPPASPRASRSRALPAAAAAAAAPAATGASAGRPSTTAGRAAAAAAKLSSTAAAGAGGTGSHSSTSQLNLRLGITHHPHYHLHMHEFFYNTAINLHRLRSIRLKFRRRLVKLTL
jgi:hypothetical protein